MSNEHHNAVLNYLRGFDNYRPVEKIFNALKDSYPTGTNLVLDSIAQTGVLSHRVESGRHEYLLKQYARDAMSVLPRAFDNDPYGYFKDEYEREQADEKLHKWYLRGDAKQRFDDYPKENFQKKVFMAAAIIELFLLALQILVGK